MLGLIKKLFGKGGSDNPAHKITTAAQGEWLITGVAYADGRKKVFRLRRSPPEGLNTIDFTCSVIIDWTYPGEMPDQAQMAIIRQFEDCIEVLDAPQGDSVQMHIITGNGKREWCYYCKNYADFIGRFNGLLKDKPRFPIEIEYEENTDWRYWKQIAEFAEGLK